MIIKTLRTADDVQVFVKCTTLPERTTTHFKYKIHSVINNIVSFEILTSPRNTIEGGFTLLCVEVADKTYTIGSSVAPEVNTSYLYGHGSDSSKDSVILTLPVREFNIYQLGMLVWNISVIKHQTKLIYDICQLCNSFTETLLPLSKINTNYYLEGFSCCPLPEFTHITFARDEARFNVTNTSNRVTASCPSWWSLKSKLYLNSAYVWDIVENLRDKLSIEAKKKVVVDNVCTACHAPMGELSYPAWCEPSNYHICETCATNIKTCFCCGSSGINYHQWGTSDQYICGNCVRIDHCFICQGNNCSSSDQMIMPIETNTIGITRHVCFTCYNAVRANGWNAAARMTPERNYSWKIEASALQVLTTNIKKEVEIKQALSVIPKEAVAALEWEFPFSENTTGTTIRDRAIWQFEEAQREAGYPDLFIAKHDGSLPSFATEFVSNMPKTLKMWHKLYFDGVLGKLAKFIDTQYVAQNAYNIGGHIHISRGSFTPTQVAKMMKFLYSNVEFLTYMCGRQQGRDGNAHYYSSTTSIHPLAFAYSTDQISPEKYTIARVTTNPLRIPNEVKQLDMGTIEVRAFKTPSTDVEVIQNVEFMFAMKDFVRAVSGKDCVKSDAFIDYTHENSKLFPLLHEKFVSRTKKQFSLNIPSCGSINNIRARATRVQSGIGIYVCTSCSREFNELSSIVMRDDNNNPLCSSCGTICDHCNCVELSSYISRVDGNHLCESCYDSETFYCDLCDCSHMNGEMVVVYNVTDEFYTCGSCRDEDAHRCSCGRWLINNTICSVCNEPQPTEVSEQLDLEECF